MVFNFIAFFDSGFTYFFSIIKKRTIPKQTNLLPIINKKKMFFLSLIGLFILLGVFNVIPYFVVIPIASVLLIVYDKEMIRQVDYKLLWTFVFFFIAVGNFSQVEMISTFIKEQFTTTTHTFFGSILVSQVISNVPAAILIAPFTDQVQAIFLGGKYRRFGYDHCFVS